MKIKIFSGIFALALLATAGWGVNRSMSNDSGLSDLALANVKALAKNESPQPGEPCYSNGSFDLAAPKAVVCNNPCQIKKIGNKDGSLKNIFIEPFYLKFYLYSFQV